MTNARHLRERFRHARRSHVRQRLGKLPVMSAAAIGAATLAALPATQSLDAATAPGGPERAAVVDLSAAQGRSPLGDAPRVTTKIDAAKGSAATKKTVAKPAASKKAETNKAEINKAETKKAETRKAEPAAPGKLELYYQYGVQTTPWYCGPAATRMALSARGIYPSQDDLAGRLGTTVNGTNSSVDIARVLNDVTRTSAYHATSVPTKSVTKRQVEQLRADVVDAISHGYPVVTNVVGSGQDVGGTTRSFPGGHYVTVVGYMYNGLRVKIADSANPNSTGYWMTTASLAKWAGTRGYAA